MRNVGLISDDDWFDYQLETDPRFERGVLNDFASPGLGPGVHEELQLIRGCPRIKSVG
jgi:hypothetical protein